MVRSTNCLPVYCLLHSFSILTVIEELKVYNFSDNLIFEFLRRSADGSSCLAIFCLQVAAGTT